MITKLRFTFSFTVNFMMLHERSFPIGSVILQLTTNHLSSLIVWVTLSCCVFSYLACLVMSQHISVAVFGGVDDFLKCCNRFWQHPPDLVKHLWEIRAFLLYFFVDADLLQLQLYLHDVPDASTSFQCCIQYCWYVPVVPYEMLAMQCIRFCISVWFLILLALLHYQSSTWHDKIAPVRLPPVSRLLLNN